MHPRKAGGGVDYARAVPCRAADCLLERVSVYRSGEPFARAQGVTAPQQTFETFDPVPGTVEALKYARAIGDGTSQFIWLLIYGGVGNGKTHLCNALARRALGRGVDVRIKAVAELFSELRSSFDTHGSEGVMEGLKRTFLLVLDDLGVEYGSDWEKAKFDELMTARFANARPTVLTTNRDLNELPPRIRSRFEDRGLSRMAHNSAGDYRKTKRGGLRPARGSGSLKEEPCRSQWKS